LIRKETAKKDNASIDQHQYQHYTIIY
jgi:hypothetical protein